ncbi:phospholipase D family protein [Zymobacter sp. IVIA_12111.31 C1]|uniref:phospholipase D family nuclease n=1 Tax=Zymobacter sp. IVIA_12111.31 C1 TaxID=3394854 RepID=UPI0039C0E685
MSLSKRLLTLALAGMMTAPLVSAHAETTAATTTTTETTSTVMPTIRVGFSPEGTASALVLDVINNAKRSLRMLSYVMTSPDIVNALIAAKQRGVNILVVADYNVNQSREKSQECLKALLRAGIPVRVTNAYRSLHDKVIIADKNTVQTGSFNYAYSAFSMNSENVVVITDAPSVTASFMDLWRSRWYGATDYSVDDNTTVERHL